jgi:archaemetzincin
MVRLGLVDDRVAHAIGEKLERSFNARVIHLPSLPDPYPALDAARGQYSSTIILRDLLGRCPPEASKIIAMTERDLFIPMLTFVFGQAQIGGTAAVVSMGRLRPEFYGGEPDSAVLLERSIKEAIHETGHTFGLTHCGDPSCPMSLSNAVEHVDRKGKEFCQSCTLLLADQQHTQVLKEQRAKDME